MGASLTLAALIEAAGPALLTEQQAPAGLAVDIQRAVVLDPRHPTCEPHDLALGVRHPSIRRG